MATRAYRLVLLLALAGTASFALTACADPPGERSGQPGPAAQSQICLQIRAATEKTIREGPNAPAEELRAQAEQICRDGVHYAPASPPPPVRPSPGCDTQGSGDDLPRIPLRRKTVDPPSPPVPFFASRPGRLPPTGTPMIAGVRLPKGSRCERYWATDTLVRDAPRVAARLARAFGQTGLWPVLWGTWEDPDHYMSASSDPAVAARLDPAEVLGKLWSKSRPGRFPGLARGSAGTTAPNPFDSVERPTPNGGSPGKDMVILLVPVTRPADVVSVLALGITGYFSDEVLTSVLRSWEERFGAVITTFFPRSVELAVSAPPRTQTDALRLADELLLIAPDEADGREEIARSLRSGDKPTNGLSRILWSFAWPD